MTKLEIADMMNYLRSIHVSKLTTSAISAVLPPKEYGAALRRMLLSMRAKFLEDSTYILGPRARPDPPKVVKLPRTKINVTKHIMIILKTPASLFDGFYLNPLQIRPKPNIPRIYENVFLVTSQLVLVMLKLSWYF